jgi:ferredoxin
VSAFARWDGAVAAGLDRVFPPAANPWRHLGSLAFLAFVACAATGVYLYIVFDTSLSGAYESGRALDASVFGRLVRGFHRYSADAFALFTALHLLREAVRGHFRFHRAWSWLSGLVLVPLAWLAGLTGFWLAWDERALFSAAATAEWLAAWPWGVAAFTRNFVLAAAMSDRFFSLTVFLHIGVPLLALGATWAHLQRLSHVRAWPPAVLGAPLLAALAVLALAHPATSLGPANALAAPASLAIDWFYHFPHALAPAFTPEGLSIAAVAAATLLAALPWIGRGERPLAAAVDLANCNGCGRCAADCPFGAVVMAPRTDARPHPRQAHVIADLCSSCGICAGACPSATPFRRRSILASGIDLPQRPVSALRAELDRALEAGPGAEVVFACAPMARRGAIEVECAAMVPPAFVQYALRGGAARVTFATCREGDCEHRLGDRWLRERLAGTRAPALRASVPRDQVQVLRGESR